MLEINKIRLLPEYPQAETDENNCPPIDPMFLETKLSLSYEEMENFCHEGASSFELSHIVRNFVVVKLFPSQEHPKHIHYEIIHVPSGHSISSILPIKAYAVGLQLDHALKEFNIDCGCISWREKVEASSRELKKASPQLFDKEYVYFVKAGDFIKIGKSNGSPYARIKTLQTGCPYKMNLVAFVEGGLKEEQKFHKKFSKYRIRPENEWFKFEGALAAFIKTNEVIS